MPLALVTGSAKRIGRAITLALAHKGWDIAVHYAHSEPQAKELLKALQNLGVKAQAFCADLADEAAVRALLPKVSMEMGAVQAVVNNAALFEFDDAASFSYEMLASHMNINVGAAVILTQALYTHRCALLSDDQISSAVAVNLLDQKLWNLNPDYLTYTFSKAALKAATETLATSLAPQVRVVGVAPGLTLPSQSMDAEVFARLHTLSPLGYSSSPEDIAQAVCFAIENKAMTGTTLLVDGGQHLMPMARDFSLMSGFSNE